MRLEINRQLRAMQVGGRRHHPLAPPLPACHNGYCCTCYIDFVVSYDPLTKLPLREHLMMRCFDWQVGRIIYSPKALLKVPW